MNINLKRINDLRRGSERQIFPGVKTRKSRVTGARQVSVGGGEWVSPRDPALEILSARVKKTGQRIKEFLG